MPPQPPSRSKCRAEIGSARTHGDAAKPPMSSRMRQDL
jgi:hypothetical protein